MPTSPVDEQPFVRQWRLMVLLAAPQGHTLRELAQRLDVSTKTIERDLDVLTRVGFHLVQSTGQHGRKSWRLDVDPRRPRPHFTVDEAAALYLGRVFLEPLAGTIIWNAAHRAFQKIRDFLGGPALKHLQSLAAFHHTRFGLCDYSRQSELLDSLMVALEDHRVTRLSYHAAEESTPADREIHPLGLVWHRGAIYVVAHNPARAAIRHYKLDRVVEVTLLEEKFEHPPFDLEAHLAHSLGIFKTDGPLKTVRIRFAPEVSRHVQEHHFHTSQKLTPQPDGSLICELQLTQFEELQAWLLGYGSKAIVEAPAEFRTQMQTELMAALGNYESSKLRTVGEAG